MNLETQKNMVAKTAYAAVGAPIVVARKVKDLGTRLMSDAQTQFDAYADEGEKATKQLKERNVVEELEHRMNIDKVQDRVEQLREQLETTLNNWRESFTPEGEVKKAPATKPTAKKAPATKATAKKVSVKKAPASKATTKKAAASKATTKKTSGATKKATVKATAAK